MLKHRRVLDNSNNNVSPGQILLQIAKRHTEDLFMTEVKNGPTHTGSNLRILDGFAIKKSWANPCFTGYEVKVSRSDFTGDTKWPSYLPLCHMFYFACPKDLISPEELPPEVGLIWYNPERDTIVTKKKAVYRLIEPSPELLLYILFTRTESDRHPFFSDRREYLEALLADKAERKLLGHRVNNYLTTQISNLDSKVKKLEHEVAAGESTRRELDKIKFIARNAGLRVGYGFERDLERHLNSKVNPDIAGDVDRLLAHAEALKLKLKVQQDGMQEGQANNG